LVAGNFIWNPLGGGGAILVDFGESDLGAATSGDILPLGGEGVVFLCCSGVLFFLTK
jgi:hypothetical protein